MSMGNFVAKITNYWQKLFQGIMQFMKKKKKQMLLGIHVDE